MRQTRSAFRPALTLLVAASILGACRREESSGAGFVAQLPPTPAEHAAGEAHYDTHCAACHGPKATGTTVGPPLVHRVYEPSHHSDASFHLAVRRGVVAHHWRFGNMPPQPLVSDEELTPIIDYVRWLQRQAGIE